MKLRLLLLSALASIATLAAPVTDVSLNDRAILAARDLKKCQYHVTETITCGELGSVITMPFYHDKDGNEVTIPKGYKPLPKDQWLLPSWKTLVAGQDHWLGIQIGKTGLHFSYPNCDWDTVPRDQVAASACGYCIVGDWTNGPFYQGCKRGNKSMRDMDCWFNC
ncbi:hypothetical protein BDV96DRAFT_597307 [Lophiotrema nucula]|uniref:Uncharacterized protein n=1 Tax=Lophiotrema nucula TaxID=690887 RepID=A0A6A5ZG82_9PLEO|nr:hypothetical protein BDV96DRAFT_597307 [Lophiotrema nucula]